MLKKMNNKKPEIGFSQHKCSRDGDTLSTLFSWECGMYMKGTFGLTCVTVMTVYRCTHY